MTLQADAAGRSVTFRMYDADGEGYGPFTITVGTAAITLRAAMVAAAVAGTAGLPTVVDYSDFDRIVPSAITGTVRFNFSGSREDPNTFSNGTLGVGVAVRGPFEPTRNTLLPSGRTLPNFGNGWASLARCTTRIAWRFTAPPTAGTFDISITSSAFTTVNITSLAYTTAANLFASTQGTASTGLQSTIQAALPSGWFCAVTGGPLPYGILYVSIWHPTIKASVSVSINVANLTGGTALVSESTPLNIVQGAGFSGLGSAGERCQTTHAATTLVSGTTSASTNEKRLRSTGALRLTQTTPANDLRGDFQFGRDLDLSERPVYMFVHNPASSFLVSNTLALMEPWIAAGRNALNSVQLHPGWNCLTARGERFGAPATRFNVVQGIQLRVNNANSQQNVGALDNLNIIISDNRYNPVGQTPVLILVDDHLTTFRDNGIPIFRRFPQIPYGMGIVPAWAISGTRSTGTNTEGATVMTTAELAALALSDPQVEFLTHSYNHHRYENGVDLATTGAGTEWALQWAYGATATGTFTLNVNNGTTNVNVTGIAVAVDPRTLASAINTAWGSTICTDVQHYSDTTANTLGPQYSHRLVFNVPVTLTASANANIVVGRAWSAARIADEYRSAAVWMRQNGIPCDEKTAAIYPQGSWGPNVEAAMGIIGAQFGFLDRAVSNDLSWPAVACNYGRYQWPRVNIGSSGSFVRDAHEELFRAIRFGHPIVFTLHGVVTSGGGATDVLNTDLVAFLLLLNDLNGGPIHVLKPSDWVQYVNIAGAATF
jgi:hypothetical protein